MKILFAGGGTAGHIFPIISIVREIKKRYSDENLEIFYIGPKDEFEELLLGEGIKIKTILAGKIRRYFKLKAFFQNLIDILFKIPIGFLQALFYVFFISPDLIFSKGGYGSMPVVLAGWFLVVPIFLHESDIAPGFANRLASKLSLEIFVSFPVEKTKYFPPKKIISVGNPVRTEILSGEKEAAKKLFNLTGEKPILLILGGSQGSQRINDILLLILPEILKNFEIIHQTGKKNFQETTSEAKAIIDENIQKYYHPFPFLTEEELKQSYAAADLIISRAGSGSIFEIASVGKPGILIPLPESAQNHQLENAYLYAETGAALVIEESNLTPHFFLERVKYLFSRPQILKEMMIAAANFSKPRAGKIIAEYLLAYLTQ